MATVNVTIARYGRRNWAVYLNGELLAVTVYRKGAFAVREALGNGYRTSVDATRGSIAPSEVSMRTRDSISLLSPICAMVVKP